MFYKKFVQEELVKVLAVPEPFVDDGSMQKIEQFVPVTDKNGNLLTVGMQVDFEPIKEPFTSYSVDFALKSGNVRPLSTYPPSAFKIVEFADQLNLQNVE